MIDRSLVNILKKIKPEEDIEKDLPSFGKYLIEDLKLFHSEKDLKLFILQYIEKAFLEEDADCPIRYYSPNEKISEEEKYVDADVECLNDKVVSQMKSGSRKKKKSN